MLANSPGRYAQLSNRQVSRLSYKVLEKLNEGMGYQPFGMDARTMWLVKPELMDCLTKLNDEVKRRVNAGSWNL